MTQDPIIQKLSDEADVATAHVHWSHNANDSERRKFWRNTFAALVAAHERELCAKVCMKQHYDLRTRQDFAAAIRARNNKEQK